MTAQRAAAEEGHADALNLTAAAREQVAKATAHRSGRSARTVHGGSGTTLRQTLIALAAGQALAEHANPGEATLHVLLGRVRLDAGERSWEGCSGDLLLVPQERHSVAALEDSAVLLTSVNRP